MSAASRVHARDSAASAKLTSLVPAISSFAVVLVLGVGGGGFQPVSWRLTSLALLALAVAALVTRERIALDRYGWSVLGGFAMLAGWTAVSATWSIHSSASLLEGERALLYLAAIAVVLLAADRANLSQLAAGTVAAMSIVAIVGLGEQYLVAHPRSPIEGTLLFQPLGYANALGIYAAIGILLATGLALSVRSAPARLAALAPLAVLVPTLALTSSRGAWIALAVGVVAMLHLARRIRSPIVLGALLIGGVLAGAAIGSTAGQGLSVLVANRPHYWHVAWLEFVGNPLLGRGAGTFGDYFWRYHRPSEGFTLDAHNLYLQTLAELGPLGFVLLVGALVVPLLRLRGKQEPLVAALGGAYVAFLLHLGVDWDWKIPAVALTGVFCGTGVLLATRRASPRTLSGTGRRLLATAVVLLAAVVLFRLETGPTLPL